MKMELIEGSETSAISIVTPGNYPKENILQPEFYFDLKFLNSNSKGAKVRKQTVRLRYRT